ncbi:MAG: AAA family ATPase [Ardenticatenaceae bacterium]
MDEWRDLAADRDAADTLLSFGALRERHKGLQERLNKLLSEPPQFDKTDLAAVLASLSSALRWRNQIAEANALEVLVPTLRGFLFNEEESLEEKFSTYPAHLRYAGHTILAELWGWAHIEDWPVYNQRALVGLRRLGWEVPKRDYLAFARAFAELREFYEQGKPVAHKLPLNLEIDHFLSWAYGVLDDPVDKASSASSEAAQEPEQAIVESEVAKVEEDSETPPMTGSSMTPLGATAEEAEIQGAEESPLVWNVQAIREFGAPYKDQDEDEDQDEAPRKTWPDRPLALPTVEHLSEAETRIRAQLALPADVIRRVCAHLLAGRHLILTGAPGTGKSHLASLLATELFGYYPMLVTATAEWSAFDVVGGLVPLAGESGVLRYDVRPGVVYEALRRNWSLTKDDQICRDAEKRPLRVETIQEGKNWHGTWLIIDELNRADVDKAFGDLFTALESGMLRVPRAGTEPSALIPLPKDFRILATLNTRDRHFLFTLSDALKRRFAFVEIESPSDIAQEHATLLRRAISGLKEQALEPNEESLRAALDTLHPIARLLRAFHPLGSAPLLACLRYVGAAQHLTPPPLDKEEAQEKALNKALQEQLLQEAVVAEILPQLEGMRDLALRLLAHLFHGERDMAFTLLSDALTHAYGDPSPLRALRALATLAAPTIAERATRLQRASTTDPATLTQALALLEQLRPHASAIPAPNWPRVAAQLETWSEERGI